MKIDRVNHYNLWGIKKKNFIEEMENEDDQIYALTDSDNELINS